MPRARLGARRPAAFTRMRQRARIGSSPPTSRRKPRRRPGRRGPGCGRRTRAPRILRVALQAQHEGMAVDDAGRGRQQRREQRSSGSSAQRLARASSQSRSVDAVGGGLRPDGREAGDLRLVGGDDQLAEAAVRDAALAAIVVEQLPCPATQAAPSGCRRVVDAGVDDLGLREEVSVPMPSAASSTRPRGPPAPGRGRPPARRRRRRRRRIRPSRSCAEGQRSGRGGQPGCRRFSSSRSLLTPTVRISGGGARRRRAGRGGGRVC